MAAGEVRDEAVDGIVAAFTRIYAEGRDGPDERELAFLDSCTPAERQAALAIMTAEAGSHRAYVQALRDDPASVAAETEMRQLVHGDETPADFTGLPEDAPGVLYLHLAWPWSPEDTALAASIMPRWTAGQRAAFEERFRLPFRHAGFHWET